MSLPSVPLLYSNFTGNIRPRCGDTQLTFYWYTPSSDGGSPITNYYLSSISGNDSNSPYTLDSNVFQTTISGLSNGVNYTYVVAASNTNGLGPLAEYRTVEPGFTPSIPSTISTVSVNANSASISWTAPLSNGGADIKWYFVQAKPTDSNFSTIRKSANAYDRTRNLELDTNTTYSFSVAAVNDPGYSLYRSTPVVYTPTTNGLLLYLDSTTYSGGSNWPDSSSNGRNATLVGATGQTINGYAFFDGSSYFTASNGAFLSTFTLSLWYQPFSVRENGAGLLVTSSSPGNFQFYSDTNGSYQLYGQLTDGNIITSSSFPLSNTWNNITITNNGTNLVTYLNNSNIGTVTPGYPLSNGGNPSTFLLGGGAGNPINGLIAQALIYDRALTSNEINRIYKSKTLVDTFPWTARHLTFLNYSTITQTIEQTNWLNCWAVSKASISNISSFHISLQQNWIAGASFFGLTSSILSGFNIVNGYELVNYACQPGRTQIYVTTLEGNDIYGISGFYTSTNVFSINCTSSNIQFLVDSNLFYQTTNSLSSMVPYYLALGIVNQSNILSNIDFGPGTVPIVDTLVISSNNFQNGLCYCTLYAGGIWVAGGAGYNSAAKYSTDGSNWSNTSNFDSNGNQYFDYYATRYSVAYSQDQNLWVMVGAGTSSIISYSGNGSNWSNIQSGTLFNNYGTSVVYASSMWVAGGHDTLGGATLKYSSNGSNWSNTNISSVKIWSVHYANGIWHAGTTSDNNNSASTILYSTNGSNWSNTNNSMYANTISIGYGNSLWVAVGNDNGNSPIKYSGDGINWSNQSNATFNSLGLYVSYVNNLWIALGQYGPNSIFYSSNGYNWLTTTGGFNGYAGFADIGGTRNSLAYGDGVFVIVGADNAFIPSGPATIKYSFNGSNWYNYKNNIYGYQLTGISVSFHDGLFITTGSSYGGLRGLLPILSSQFREVLRNGLVLQLESSTYAGGSTWIDSSYSGNDATLVGTGQTSNGYVYFNGSTYFGTSSFFPYFSNWTLSLWIQPFTTPTGTILPLFGQTYPYNNFSIMYSPSGFNIAPAGYAGFSFSADSGNQIATSTINIINNVWNNVVVTYNGSTITAYLNNTIVSSNDQTGIFGAGGQVFLGAGNGNYMTGLIGEALIYNRALSAVEVRYNYQATLPLYV